ncbi:hypothetical protein BG011_005230, partial [Mortierella polycephala]
MPDIRRAMDECVMDTAETDAMIMRYLIRMNIDPVVLLEVCASLGSQFLCDPDSVAPVFHLVCCQMLQQMQGEENTILTEQLLTDIQMYEPQVQQSELPELHTFGTVQPHHQKDRGGSVHGNHATLLPIDIVCSHCAYEMPESVTDRVYMKQQWVVLKCLGADQAQGCFLGQLEVILKGDLTNTVALGDSIQLLGRTSRTFPRKCHGTYMHGIQFEVNNVLREPNKSSVRVPEAISKILDSNLSGWNTSQAIVDLMGEKTVGLWRNIWKRLINAVALEEKDYGVGNTATRPQIRSSVHVLVTKNAHDTVVPALMANVASTRNTVFWDHGEEVSRKPLYTVRPPGRSCPGEIEASVLSPANRGILLFELDQLDKKSQGHISPNGSDINIQREGDIQTMDLVCCCWSTYTSATSNASKATYGVENSPEGEINSKPAQVIQNEMEGLSDASQKIAAHTMGRHMADHSGKLGNHLSCEELSQYIQLASAMKVRMSFESEDLLKAYFQVMRKKGSGLDTNELSSVSVMSTLLNLAICHAKLCLRPVADTMDAL